MQKPKTPLFQKGPKIGKTVNFPTTPSIVTLGRSPIFGGLWKFGKVWTKVKNRPPKRKTCFLHVLLFDQVSKWSLRRVPRDLLGVPGEVLGLQILARICTICPICTICTIRQKNASTLSYPNAENPFKVRRSRVSVLNNESIKLIIDQLNQ